MPVYIYVKPILDFLNEGPAYVSGTSWYRNDCWTVFLYEKRRIVEFVGEIAEEAKYQRVSKARAYTMYVLNAAVIIAASYLPHLGERIAELTGLGRTFVGSIFIALSTSLSEVVVTLGAFRIGAVDIALGNLFGSNLSTPKRLFAHSIQD